MQRPASTAHVEPGLRVGFLVVGRRRRGFDMDYGRQIEEAAWTAMTQTPLESFRPETRVVDDATLRKALAEMREHRCEALVTLQPIMGDGRLAPVLAQVWGDPPVLWATPERQDGDKVSSCSLVGAHVFGSTLRQLGHRFELVYGDPGDSKTRHELTAAVRVAAAAARLRRAKAGLIGAHAPGFINMQVDPAAMSGQIGIELHHFGLAEFFELVDGQSDEAVAEDVARVEALSLPFGDDVGPDDLPQASRFYLAMRALLSDENLDALALRCWPEVPNRYGQWPYLAIARLVSENRAVALEGDTDGAICGLVGRLLGIGVGYLSDWLAHDEHSITLWHPGNAPFYMCAPGTMRLGRHFNSGHPVVVNATLAPDLPITLFRLWRCDGRYRMTACEARTAQPARELTGTQGTAIVDDRSVPEWFDFLCHEGMPHHVAVFSGHNAKLLRRFARCVGVQWLDGP